jgi:excisionase family DNA binding protein
MTNTSDSDTEYEDRLWDAVDVARYLKVSRSWVYQRAEAGLLPCLRVGGLIRFDPRVVQAFARGDLRPAMVLSFAVGDGKTR